MQEKDIRNVITPLVESGLLHKADAINASILADNLPKDVILHFAGETPYVIDGVSNKIFCFKGDMEDWAMFDFDISLLSISTREDLERECLYSLQGYAWRESMRQILPQIQSN